MADAELLRSVEGGIATLTLNRPAKRNALSFELLEALEVELERVAQDDSIRAVVITGAGEQAFCAGMDLSVVFAHISSNPDGPRIRKVQRELQDLFTTLERLEKPTIAAIEGACVGGGLELALCCDLRVASSAAVFGFPEAKLGMLPDLGGTARFPRFVGPSVAKEWIFTARTYPAVRALELGLLTELVVPGDALLRAQDVARECAANGALAIAWAKRIIDRSPSLSIEESLELEQHAMTEILPSAELKEGVKAFLEKRAAKFH